MKINAHTHFSSPQHLLLPGGSSESSQQEKEGHEQGHSADITPACKEGERSQARGASGAHQTGDFLGRSFQIFLMVPTEHLEIPNLQSQLSSSWVIRKQKAHSLRNAKPKSH